jgi:tetratricopeptide (TPR) repeat protein
VDFNHAKDAQRQRRYYVVATTLIGGVFAALWFATIAAFFDSSTDQLSATSPSADISDGGGTSNCEDTASQTPQCQARREALSVWSDVDNSINQLISIHVEEWAPEQFSLSETLFSDAKVHFNRSEYHKALETFKIVLEDLQSIENESAFVLKRSIETGWNALGAENTEQAVEAFDRALHVAPDHPSALKGAARAAVLDEVLALYDNGAMDRRAGRLDAALRNFESANELDSENEKVFAALGALRSQIMDRNHRRAVTVGLTALQGNNGENAKRAFETALRLKPGSEEARTGLERAEKMLTSQNITVLLASANQAAANEDWEAGLNLFTQVLRVDPAVDEAIKGKAAISELIEIEAEILSLLSSGHRLSSAVVFSHAETILENAIGMAATRPRLDKSVAKLASLMRDMRQPTEVVFRSDGKTEISIQRHGSLGVLDEQLISMLPGKYTIVGTRNGYRDVRLEIEISPFDDRQSIVVICDERF